MHVVVFEQFKQWWRWWLVVERRGHRQFKAAAELKTRDDV